MKKLLLVAVATVALILSAGCAKKANPSPPSPPTETIQQGARDTAAALNGALLSAQSKYQATCAAKSSQAACQLINRGIAAQNALITADQAYCGWSATVAPSDPNAVCVPVTGTNAALTAAITNAAAIIAEIQTLVKP